ncbi:MAG: 5-methylthioadenosine/S-adenosylhomocysteine deaminase [Alphaproteobacteria bacterium]|jgi:5-methylthioadenosine/S-adenosylhomocysteine deaminase|nr:5-methylthioadenosine/S-adenosylhomocysteine deaminase [Alphaproteobacteria bacterium]
MSRLLISNGYVVTVDDARNVYPGGFVAIDGARISAVGPSAQMPGPGDFDEVIDASGSIVVPGLINMHQHHWYTLFKGLADGFLLEDWVTDLLLPLSLKLDADAMRVSSYVAGMEMISTGTTCSLNHSVTTTTPELVAASIEPQAELGIRQVYAKELRCRTPGNPHHAMSLDEALAAFEDEAARWNCKHDGLVRFGIAIESNAHWVAAGMSTETLICRGYELAKRLDLKITAHISGGTFSLEKGFLKYLRETGRTDVRYLMQLGILDPQWILIHGIHVTELDIEQMASVGCSFVYTPTSESIRGGGISPFANAHRAGVNVALGTDGPMVDYSVDMVEQMKVCSLMQHVRHLDPRRMPVERTLEMATINAAKALGLEDEIGSLEAGKRADIAIFDLRKPYVGVLHRPLTSFITAGKGSDVRAVLVDGHVVYRDGQFAHLSDVAGTIAAAENVGGAIIEQAGLSSRLAPAWRF